MQDFMQDFFDGRSNVLHLASLGLNNFYAVNIFNLKTSDADDYKRVRAAMEYLESHTIADTLEHFEMGAAILVPCNDSYTLDIVGSIRRGGIFLMKHGSQYNAIGSFEPKPGQLYLKYFFQRSELNTLFSSSSRGPCKEKLAIGSIVAHIGKIWRVIATGRFITLENTQDSSEQQNVSERSLRSMTKPAETQEQLHNRAEELQRRARGQVSSYVKVEYDIKKLEPYIDSLLRD